MNEEKAIEVIQTECYVGDLLNLDRTRQINSALDKAVEALRECKRGKDATGSLVVRLRELQRNALKNGYTSSGGYCRAVSDCLRILFEEFEGGKDEDYD